MAVDNHQLQVYQKIWELILSDADFRTVSQIEIGANNQIRVDSGKVHPTKKTAGQDGDLPELYIGIGELRDDGDDGTEDHNRPTFALAQGEVTDDPSVIEYDYHGTITYPNEKFEDFFPLLEVIRRNVRGYQLRKAGLVYVRNVTVIATFQREAEFRQTTRPQHQITITAEIIKN